MAGSGRSDVRPLVDVVVDRLRAVGWGDIVAGDGSVAGLPGWTVLVRRDREAALEALRGAHGRTVVICAAIKGPLLVVVGLRDVLISAAKEILRRCADLRAAVSVRAFGRRVGDFRGSFAIDGEPGCALPLDEWLEFMLAWRLFVHGRRERELLGGISLPAAVPLPTPVDGRRWVAYDYDAVRAAEVAAQTDYEIRTYNRPLVSSVMGSLCTSGIDPGADGELGPPLPAGTGGRRGRPRKGSGKKKREEVPHGVGRESR